MRSDRTKFVSRLLYTSIVWFFLCFGGMMKRTFSNNKLSFSELIEFGGKKRKEKSIEEDACTRAKPDLMNVIADFSRKIYGGLKIDVKRKCNSIFIFFQRF